MIFSFLGLVFFFHFVGIIIGLGAVTVIDVMGFLSRKSKSWTQTTVAAHHVTKVLIMFGSLIVGVTLALLVYIQGFTMVNLVKVVLFIVLFCNGCFLFFHISPIIDTYRKKDVLFSRELQLKVIISMIISFVCWWLFVALTIHSFF